MKSMFVKCVGRSHEWYLDISNSFEHLAFQFLARLHQLVVLLRTPFLLAGFNTIGTIRHTMRGDGDEQVAIEFVTCASAW